MQKKDVKAEKKKANVVTKFFQRDFSAWILLVPMLFCVYYFILRPQILSIYWSFYDMVKYEPQEFVGLKNYIMVVTRPDFLQTVKNTVMYVF